MTLTPKNTQKTLQTFKYLTLNNILFYSLIVILCFIYFYLPVKVTGGYLGGTDLYFAFMPAARNLMQGINPYTTHNFFSPFWVALVIIPFLPFPYLIGYTLLYTSNIISFLYVFMKLKINRLMIILTLLCGGIAISQLGNIEGFVALGLLLPPQIGLFFIMMKPQIGIGVAIFWGFKMLRQGGIKLAIKTFLPVTVCFLLSFLVFGNYMGYPTTAWWNASIFPYGVPIGLMMITLSVWKNKMGFAIMSGPFLAPYLGIHTWLWVVLGFGVVLAEYKNNPS